MDLTNVSDMEFPKVIQLTEDEKSDIFRMRHEGSSLREISEYIGCSVSTVSYQLRKAGVVNESLWTEEDDEKLVVMYNAGVPTADIGRQLGRPKDSVQHRAAYLRKLGRRIKYRYLARNTKKS